MKAHRILSFKMQIVRFILISLSVTSLLPTVVLSQTSYPLVIWDFNGKSGQSAVMATFNSGGLSSVAPSTFVSAGAGVAICRWGTGNGFTVERTAVTLADAIKGNNYISFSLTPLEAQIFSITAVKFIPMSQNKTRTFSLLSSVGGFNDSNVLGTVTSTAINTLQTIPVANHTNINSTIEFRIYVYGVPDYWLAYYETFGLGNRISSQPYDLLVEGYIPDYEAPTTPTGLTTSAVTTAYLNLSWNASKDNLGVSKYEIYKNGVLCGTSTTTKFQVGGLRKATSYSITVKAKDAYGNSSEASEAMEVLTPLAPVVKNKMGINPYFAADWGKDHAFADVMEVARQWCKGAYYTSTPVNLDSNGWPTEDANIVVWHGVSKMNGTYKLIFNGSAAAITIGFGPASITNAHYDSKTNTTYADIVYKSTENYGLLLGFKGTKGGIRNVKLMRPLLPGSTESYDPSVTFTTPFKNMMSKFSVIRFLSWEKINGSPDSLWENRTKENCYHASSLSGIMAWEKMIQLCNETNMDAYINVPMKATTDYITQLASLWKEKLNPNLNVYVEFSNEIWNTGPGFPQYFTHMAATKAEIAAGGSTLNFDGETTIWNLGWRRVAQKTVEVSNLFRQVWGDSAMMTRVRPVIMWQQGDAQGTASEALKWLDHYSELTHKPINYYIYGAGGSAYYGPDNNCDTLTIDNIWQSFTNNTANWIPYTTRDLFVATAMGCKRISYEGGPSMDRSEHSESVKAAMWADDRMEDVIIDHHNFWSSTGGDLLVYFTTTGDYQWGFSDDCYDLNTPKFRGIDRLNEVDRYPVTVGVEAPFIIDGKEFDYTIPSYYSKGLGNHILNGISQWAGYLFRSDSAEYNVSVQYTMANNSVLQYYLDGFLLGEEVINGAGTTSTFTMKLNEGLHNIRVKQKSDAGFQIAKVIVGNGAGKISGIKEIENDKSNNITIYPNPAKDYVNIAISTQLGSTACLSMYDMLGKEVYRTNNVLNNGSIRFPTDKIANGIYTLNIIMNNKCYIEKLVVRK